MVLTVGSMHSLLLSVLYISCKLVHKCVTFGLKSGLDRLQWVVEGVSFAFAFSFSLAQISLSNCFIRQLELVEQRNQRRQSSTPHTRKANVDGKKR